MDRFAAGLTKGELARLSERLRLDTAAHQRALQLAGLVPTAAGWVGLLQRLLLAFGVAYLCAGAAAFIAHNWAELHRFAKFAGIELALVMAVAVAARRGLDSVGGRASLFAAAVLVGVLLALFGQVYQTGADPYGLFLAWALFLVGWAAIGRHLGLWMLVLILANLSLIMYWTQLVRPPDGWWSLSQAVGPMVWLPLTVTDAGLAGWLFMLNATVLVAWEANALRRSDVAGKRWFPRAIVLAMLVMTTIGTWAFVLEVTPASAAGVLAPLCFVLLVGGCLWFYTGPRRDLGILTATLAALIVIVTTVFLRALGFDDGTALVLAVLVLGQTIGATLWLKHLAGGTGVTR